MQIGEEEKKSIEIVKEIPHNHHEEIFMSEDLAIAKVLNLIEKQSKEIEIKDKMIDEIIAYLFNITGFRLLIKENGFCENIEKCINDDEKCFKEYFRKKAKENGKDIDKRGLEELG